LGRKKPKDLLKLQLDPRTTGRDEFISYCAKTFQLGDEKQLRKELEPWFELPPYQLFDNSDWVPAPKSNIRLLVEGRGDGPLTKVLNLLEAEENWSCLGEILRRDEYGLPELYDITRALQLIHWSLKCGPKPKNTFLTEFVSALTAYWRKATGKPFTQGWRKMGGFWMPVTKDMGAEFVYTVVHYFNPVLIPPLRKAMEHEVARSLAPRKVTSSRKRSTSRK
jgi:hypothetical protein